MSTASEQQASQEPVLRVLSLDGGGIRGYLTARILVEIEKYLDGKTNSQKPLGQRFDLVVGTSTGGLIALGLAVGKTAKEVLEFYETYGPKIFGGKENKEKENDDGQNQSSCSKNPSESIHKNKRRSWFSALFQPQFRGDALKASLENELFKEKKFLRDISRPRVAVISVGLDTGMMRKYASNYFPLHVGREDEELVDCALATTAAPTFFPVQEKLKHSNDLVDGGLVANNPAMIALIDACKILEIEDGKRKPGSEYAANVKMLSVGTGQVRPLPYYSPRCADLFLSNIRRMRKGGLLHWAKAIPEVFISCQSALVEFQMSFFLPRDNYLRINPQIHPIELDDVGRMDELKNYSNLTQEHEKKLLDLFPRDSRD